MKKGKSKLSFVQPPSQQIFIPTLTYDMILTSVTLVMAKKVRTDDLAELSCSTSPSHNIQFCVFTKPDGTSFILKKNFTYEDGRLTYAGEDESTDCGVRILGVEEKDNGEWKCFITTIKDGQYVTVENAVSVIVFS